MYKTFVLPLPPSDNALYFNSPNMRGHGRVPTKAFKEWKEEAELILSGLGIYGLRQNPGAAKITWKMHMVCYMDKKNLWKSDLSNRFKLLFDCVSKTIGIDDRYLTFYQATKDDLKNANHGQLTEYAQMLVKKEHVYCRLIIEYPEGIMA